MATYPARSDFLYYVGKSLTVEWYYTEAGRLPGLEHYRTMGESEQERLDHMVVYLADAEFGTRLPITMYRLEDPGHQIYAFKPRAERFFNFMTLGRKIVIVNAYSKHSQQMDKKARRLLETAIASRMDYLHRVKKGTYYEKP